jgi:XapX domain-containing protein
MKLYLISLAAGTLVGVIYGLLDVCSPAPPIVALIGLLGMLLGEQAVPLAKRLIAREPINVSWLSLQCGPHVLGQLPRGPKAKATRESKQLT